jgi:hypothetical protein
MKGVAYNLQDLVLAVFRPVAINGGERLVEFPKRKSIGLLKWAVEELTLNHLPD